MRKRTLSKKEWNKIDKHSKYISIPPLNMGLNKKFYLVKYEDLKGTYLEEIKIK